MKERLIVLDFASGNVHVFPWDSEASGDISVDVSDFLDKINEEQDLDIREKDCHYMVTKKSIIIH